jgi:plastocyanin
VHLCTFDLKYHQQKHYAQVSKPSCDYHLNVANDLAPVVAGLAVGIAFILLFAIVFHGNTQGLLSGTNRNVAHVLILSDNGPTTVKVYKPDIIKVVIGVNNTVVWVNSDTVPAFLEADNASDPKFYNATKDFVLIDPNKSFSFTFTMAGEFGYHGKPWQRGMVIVMPHQASKSNNRTIFQAVDDRSNCLLCCLDQIITR